MTPLGNSPRRSWIHPPEQLPWFFQLRLRPKMHRKNGFRWQLGFSSIHFLSIPPGHALTFQGASPWVPPSLGFPCRMHKRHNWRKYVKNTEKEEKKTYRRNNDRHWKPSPNIGFDFPCHSTDFTHLRHLPERTNPLTGPTIGNPPPGYHYDM